MMLAESIPNPGRFHVVHPLWTLHNGVLERQQRIGSKRGILLVSAPILQEALPIFTDVDVAARFIEDVGWPNVKPMSFQTPKELLAAVKHFHNARQAQQVAIDISLNPPGAKMLVPVAEFIDDIRRGDV
jgi:hypothetical protein